MKKLILIVLTASLAATGCQKMPLFGLLGSAVIRPNVNTSLMTKGATTTTNDLNAFQMMAVTGEYIDHTISESVKQTPTNGVYFNACVKKTGSGASASWNIYASASATTPKDYYWINGNPIAFWSWAPFGDSVKGTLSVDSTPVVPPATGCNTLEFNYTLPAPVTTTAKTDATNQQDLIFAGNVESRTFKDGTDDIKEHSSTNTNYTRNDNQLDIVFHHALSKVMFGVDVTDNTFHKSLKIKNIEIIDVYSSGTCAFTAPSTFNWPSTSLSTKKTYSQDYGADFSSCTGATGAPDGWPYNSSNGLNVCSNAFFLIPQSTSGISVKITFEFEGATMYKTVSLPTTDTWKADHYYLYKVKAQGSRDGVTLALTLADWAERGYTILL